jgi:hypothetical protein
VPWWLVGFNFEVCVSLSCSDWLGPILLGAIFWCRSQNSCAAAHKCTPPQNPHSVDLRAISDPHGTTLFFPARQWTPLRCRYIFDHSPAAALETLRTFCSCHSFRSIPIPTLFIPLNFALFESLYVPFCRRSFRKGPQTLLRLSRTSILGRYES